MRGEQAPGRFAVAGFESGKNGRMFFDGIAPAPLRAEREITGAFGPRQQRLVRLAQRRVPCRPNDQAVYLPIDGEIIVESAVPMKVLHSALQEAKSLQFAFGGALGGKFGGESLDSGERFEQLEDAIRFNVGDARAAVRAQFYQPFGGQQLHGFAQRGSRNAERCGEFGFLRRGARRQFAANNHGPHPCRSALMQARPLELECLSTGTDVRFFRTCSRSVTYILTALGFVARPKYQRMSMKPIA